MTTKTRATLLLAPLAFVFFGSAWGQNPNDNRDLLNRADDIVTQGQEILRFDTFGDEQFWTGTLQLNQAIEGAALGGVGPGVSPRTALELGLKVDVNALPH